LPARTAPLPPGTPRPARWPPATTARSPSPPPSAWPAWPAACSYRPPGGPRETRNDTPHRHRNTALAKGRRYEPGRDGRCPGPGTRRGRPAPHLVAIADIEVLSTMVPTASTRLPWGSRQL